MGIWDVINTIIFPVIGGLGIFLMGMKYMSEGMQTVAGDKMRKLINAVTNNRLMACGVGTLVTCMIQSSSVTTVMVVGMVNAGLMTLAQSIGVILGANIGTTITGWILVLKIGKYGLPIVGFAAMFFLFSKKDKIRYTAMMLVGLGLVFFGLELMSGGFKPLRNMPEFIDWMSRFRPENYFGVLKCVMVGAILTSIVQSSSAMLGITISLATTGVIDFPTAAALVLGENIGTTITALLASIGVSKNAKRASFAHMMVNVLGVCWIVPLFFVYAPFILKHFGTDIEGNVNITKAIAATHTGFNVLNVLLFLPFVTLISRLLLKIVPESAEPEVKRLTYLDVAFLDTPSLGIEQSRKEIVRMGQTVSSMMDSVRGLVNGSGSGKLYGDTVFESERQMDVFQKEITEFLGDLIRGNISQDVSAESRRQLRIADEYESVADYVTALMKLHLKLEQAGFQMGREAAEEMEDLQELTGEYMEMINKAFIESDSQVLAAAGEKGRLITARVKEYRSRHLERMAQNHTTPLKSLIYTDMLNSYRRIKDHGFNIAEVLAS